MKIKKVNGVWIREDCYDVSTLAEIPSSYGWMDVKNKKVLDIGGCFGGFSHMALERGAKEVTIVEPSKDNIKMIRKNLGKRATIIHAAAVANKDLKKIDLYKSTSGRSFGNFSTTPIRGRTTETVNTVYFKDLLAKVRPHTIKMDCEGCEYDLLLNIKLPSYVKQIAMEIHLNKKEWREVLYPELLKLFKGWTVVKKPSDTKKNWVTIAGWKR